MIPRIAQHVHFTDILHSVLRPRRRAQAVVAQALIGRFHGESAFLVGTGTQALKLAFVGLGLGRDDQICLPALCCPAVLRAVLSVGAVPRFVDVAPNSINLDPALALEEIRSGAHAVVAVHYRGFPMELSLLTGLPAVLIEDCCGAVGSSLNGEEVGTVGDATIISFGWGKPLTAGGGGALVLRKPATWTTQVQFPSATPRDAFRSLTRLLCLAAWPTAAKLGVAGAGMVVFKLNRKSAMSGGSSPEIRGISEFQGRLLARQVPCFDQWANIRHLQWTNLAAAAILALGPDAVPTLPDGDTRCACTWFPVFAGKRRDALRAHLRSRGVDTGTAEDEFLPREFGSVDESKFGELWPNALAKSTSIAYIPVGPALSNQDVARICAALASFRL